MLHFGTKKSHGWWLSPSPITSLLQAASQQNDKPSEDRKCKNYLIIAAGEALLFPPSNGKTA